MREVAKTGSASAKQFRHRRSWYRGALLRALDLALDKNVDGASLSEEDIMALQSYIQILEGHTPGEIENAINHLKLR